MINILKYHLISLFLKNKTLKQSDKISDYSISVKKENEHFDEDGKKVFDVVIENKIIPKKTPEFVEININILPSSGLTF